MKDRMVPASIPVLTLRRSRKLYNSLAGIRKRNSIGAIIEFLVARKPLARIGRCVENIERPEK